MLRDALIIYRKEMKNIIKDRRTLFMIVVLPLVLMPVLFTVIGYTNRSKDTSIAKSLYVVEIVNNQDVRFREILGRLMMFSETDAGPDSERLTVEFPVRFRPGEKGSVNIFYKSTSEASSWAASRISAAVGMYNDILDGETLEQAGLSPDDLKPLTPVQIDTASEDSQGAGIIASMLPYLLLIYLFAGSMNIGLDATAGEKERGSLASILVNSVSRTSIAFGKVLYVLTCAIVNSLASFVGLIIGLSRMGSMIGAEISGGIALLTPLKIVTLLLTVVSVAGLAASCMVFLGSIARTMKEGGAYVLPIYLIVVMLGVASMRLDVAGNIGFYFIPLLNSVYILKAIILNEIAALPFLITIVLNIGLAALLVLLISRLYNSEKIMNTI